MSNPRPVFVVLGGLALVFWWWAKTGEGKAAVDNLIDVGDDLVYRPSDSQPRGLRNHNPGNIERRASTTWRGASADQSGDSRFVVFIAPLWGLRAMARILRGYLRDGVNTTRKIVSRWAPPGENNTPAYVAQVSGRAGLDPDMPVSEFHIPALMAAMIFHENGAQPYPDDLIAEAVELERTT